jgi:hypothetical protein
MVGVSALFLVAAVVLTITQVRLPADSIEFA